MSDRIVQLKDKDGNNVFPITDASSAKITITGTDPGEGTALAANNFIAVYGNSSGTISSSDLQDGIITPAKIDDSKFGAITLQLTSGISNTTTNSALSLTTVATQRGNITQSGGKALIGSGITMVEASSAAFCSTGSQSSTGYGWFQIRRLRGSTETTWAESICYHSSSFNSCVIPPVCIPVQEGDLVFLYCREGGKTIREGVCTYLTVKQI